MFAPLVTGRTAPGSAPRSALLSALIHGAGILPLFLLAPSPQAVRGARADPTAVWLVPVPPPRVPVQTRPPDPGAISALPPAPPSGVIPPLQVLTSIAPPDLGTGPDWHSLLAPGSRPVPDQGPVGDPPDRIRLAETVDVPARIVSAADLVYPPALRAAGVAGLVEAEFVVDTLGRVEPGSWRVRNKPLALFERAARDAALGTRFEPARVGGRPVRQLVRQRFRFRIEPER